MKLLKISIVALALLGSATPSIAQEDDVDRRYSRSQPGENAYRLACAVMWMLGYTVCLELPGAPSPEQDQADPEEDAPDKKGN
jgi:hypothetical protein